jgi:hypothetical protein
MKRLLFLIGGLVFNLATHAQTLSESMIDCSQESDSLKRLLCFDQLVESIVQSESPQIITEIIPVEATDSPMPVIQSETDEPQIRENFGLPERPLDTPDKIYGTVAKVKKNTFGKHTITFADGQVWKQTDSSRLRLKVGDQIFVEKGALGSHFLGKENTNTRMRVKRVK